MSGKLTPAGLCTSQLELLHAGDYCFVQHTPALYLYFCCPCGNGEVAGIPLYREGDTKPEPNAWLWNGSQDKPTVTPSILRRGGCNWHGWLMDGVFREC